MKRALVAGAVTLAACGTTTTTVNLTTMRAQADSLAKSTESFGTVGRAALAAGETIDAESRVPGERFGVNLRGLVGGKLCFTRITDVGTAQESDATRERVMKSYASVHYAFTLYRSLSEITTETGWPEPADKLDVTVLSGRNLRGACHASEKSTYCREDHREMTLQLCAQPPALTAEANFLGLVLVFDDSSHNRLVAWKLAP